VRTLAAILADPSVVNLPEPVAPRLAWRGRVTLLAAREKVGKSTIAQAAAAAKSSGAPFLGEPTTAGDVLLLSLEEHVGDTSRRLVEFDATAERVHIVEWLGHNPLAGLEEAIVKCEPELVVVDTLPRFVQNLVHDPGNASQWTPIMSHLTRMARDHDLALLLLHHARKSDNGYRDSSAVGAGVDVILEMEAVSDDPAARRFKVKGRWRLENFSARLVGNCYEPHTVGELSLDARVLCCIQGSPRCSQNVVRQHVGGSYGLVDAALKRLLGRGAISDVGHQNGHLYVASQPGGSATAAEPLAEPPSAKLSPYRLTAAEPPPNLTPRGSAETQNP